MDPTGLSTQPSSDDYVIFGSVPWDAPWLTEHNLAHALSERHNVLYVEPATTPLSPLRRRGAEEVGAEVRALLRRRPRRSGRLHTFRPLALPPRENVRMRKASAPLVRTQVRRVAQRLGLRRPVIIAAGGMRELLGAVDERVSVFLVKDLVETGGELLGLDAERLASDVNAMCRAADVVCTTSPLLLATLADRGVASEYLPHAFQADLAPLYDSGTPPPEYDDLPRPLLGYTGRIDARLDFQLLGALVDHFCDGSVVLVGPVSPRLPRELLAVLTQRSNVHLLGARPRTELPPYITQLDCCLLPYEDSDWIRHASPLKVWDYLYAGPPIVGAGCASLRDYPQPLVSFAEDIASFVKRVEAALANPGASRERRREFALANTWADRARTLEDLVARVADTSPDPVPRDRDAIGA